MKRFEMNRENLAVALARRGRLPQGQAQDEVDRLIHGIVRSLRRGHAAEMPGVGRLTPKRSSKQESVKSFPRGGAKE